MTTPIKPGYMDLHPDPALNFMMNRLAWTNLPDELIEIGRCITTLEDWVREMLTAAERAEREDRLLSAANFFRGAEFYMTPDAPRKVEAYERFIELHDKALPDVASQRDAVPYQGGSLPVIELPAAGAERGTMLANSGFDGVIEEMYPTLVPLAEAGYRVIAFEGPGQGGALRHSGLHMPHDWEVPIGAVLDHYQIAECTLIGMSLGGYLAPRAAAFEPRITRLVAWGAMYDFFACFSQRMGAAKASVLRNLMRVGARKQVNAAINKAGSADPTSRWATAHGMHVCGAGNPCGFFEWVMKMNLKEVSHLIRQDTLLVMGTQDHLVPFDQVYRQARALTGARSVSIRIATEQEQGAQHCQIGNPMLVVDEILRWMEGLDRRDAMLAECSPHLLTDRAA